jgi:hypothetical protein
VEAYVASIDVQVEVRVVNELQDERTNDVLDVRSVLWLDVADGNLGEGEEGLEDRVVAWSGVDLVSNGTLDTETGRKVSDCLTVIQEGKIEANLEEHHRPVLLPPALSVAVEVKDDILNQLPRRIGGVLRKPRAKVGQEVDIRLKMVEELLVEVELVSRLATQAGRRERVDKGRARGRRGLVTVPTLERSDVLSEEADVLVEVFDIRLEHLGRPERLDDVVSKLLELLLLCKLGVGVVKEMPKVLDRRDLDVLAEPDPVEALSRSLPSSDRLESDDGLHVAVEVVESAVELPSDHRSSEEGLEMGRDELVRAEMFAPPLVLALLVGTTGHRLEADKVWQNELDLLLLLTLPGSREGRSEERLGADSRGDGLDVGKGGSKLLMVPTDDVRLDSRLEADETRRGREEGGLYRLEFLADESGPSDGGKAGDGLVRGRDGGFFGDVPPSDQCRTSVSPEILEDLLMLGEFISESIESITFEHPSNVALQPRDGVLVRRESLLKGIESVSLEHAPDMALKARDSVVVTCEPGTIRAKVGSGESSSGDVLEGRVDARERLKLLVPC